MAVESSTGRCPICLEPIIGESYLDHCFHKFCFHCILQWSEMVLARSYSIRPLPLDCPLCKTHYFSIIHNCVDTSFQRHYVVNDKQTSSKRSFKSEAHMRRLAVYVQNSDSIMIKENILESSTQSREFVKSGKKVMQHAPSNQWLHCWIRRELQALMQEEDVNIVVHHVVGIFESFQRRKGNVLVPGKVNLQSTSWLSAVSTAVRPFIFEHADKFSLELEKFLFLRLDIAAYDQLTSLQCSKLPHFDSTFLEDTAVTTERLEVSRQQSKQVETLHCAEHQERLQTVPSDHKYVVHLAHGTDQIRDQKVRELPIEMGAYTEIFDFHLTKIR